MVEAGLTDHVQADLGRFEGVRLFLGLDWIVQITMWRYRMMLAVENLRLRRGQVAGAGAVRRRVVVVGGELRVTVRIEMGEIVHLRLRAVVLSPANGLETIRSTF